MVVYGKEVTYWKHWHWEQNASLLEDRLYGVWLTRWVRRFESVSRNHRMVGVASPFGSIWSNPYSNRNTQSRVPKATSRWLWKLSKEESPLPLGSPCQRPVHPTSTPEANVKLLCSCNFHVAPGQRPAPLSPASICKTRNRFHTNISPQAACGATFHESLSCSPPRRSSLSVTRRRCARLRQKVGRGSF